MLGRAARIGALDSQTEQTKAAILATPKLGISGVFAPLVGALVFKTSGRLEESRQWVRFPYTPVFQLLRQKTVSG
jgi:hypothetical protein